MPFPHKKVLITGATAGIGRALAERMLQAGVTVVAVGRRKDRLDDLVARYGADRLVAEEFDVTDLEAIPAWAEKITTAHPTLSSLILNAGIQRTLDFTTPSYADLATKTTAEITTNYTSPVLTISAFLPHLISLGSSTSPPTSPPTPTTASIILITSGLALIPLPRCANYCATKAALHHFGKSLRYQLAHNNNNSTSHNNNSTAHIRVLDVLPPAVQTELHANQPELVAIGQADIGVPLRDFVDETWAALDRWDPDEDEIMVKELKARSGHLEDAQKVAFARLMDDMKALESGKGSKAI